MTRHGAPGLGDQGEKGALPASILNDVSSSVVMSMPRISLSSRPRNKTLPQGDQVMGRCGKACMLLSTRPLV